MGKFRTFIEQGASLDPFASTQIYNPDVAPTQAYVPTVANSRGSTSIARGAAKSVSANFAGLVNAIKKVDPFFDLRDGAITGTVDYMPPEMSNSNPNNVDPDLLTYLTLTLRRTQPQLAQKLKPAAEAFRMFRDRVFALHQRMSYNEAENVELAARMDKRFIDQVVEGVAAMSKVMSQIMTQAADFYNTGIDLKELSGLFRRFQMLFQQVGPEVQQILHKSHGDVWDQRWDKTGPVTPMKYDDDDNDPDAWVDL